MDRLNLNFTQDTIEYVEQLYNLSVSCIPVIVSSDWTYRVFYKNSDDEFIEVPVESFFVIPTTFGSTILLTNIGIPKTTELLLRYEKTALINFEVDELTLPYSLEITNFNSKFDLTSINDEFDEYYITLDGSTTELTPTITKFPVKYNTITQNYDVDYVKFSFLPDTFEYNNVSINVTLRRSTSIEIETIGEQIDTSQSFGIIIKSESPLSNAVINIDDQISFKVPHQGYFSGGIYNQVYSLNFFDYTTMEFKYVTGENIVGDTITFNSPGFVPINEYPILQVLSTRSNAKISGLISTFPTFYLFSDYDFTGSDYEDEEPPEPTPEPTPTPSGTPDT